VERKYSAGRSGYRRDRQKGLPEHPMKRRRYLSLNVWVPIERDRSWKSLSGPPGNNGETYIREDGQFLEQVNRLHVRKEKG